MGWITETVYSMYDYLTGAEVWLWIAKTISRILIIVILAYVVRLIGNKVIDAVFADRKRIPVQFQLTTQRREQTLKNLLQNILSYVIGFIAIMMILDVFNVPIKTMLAGAGVFGLAIGFGAQSLVKDIIAGFFIIFEDQFSVGDYIELGEIEGDVEVIGLRTTKLRSYYGHQFVIPNGNIDTVTNYSAHNGFAMVEINLPYETDIIRTEKMVEDILETIPAKYDIFIETPYINGITMLDLSTYVMRIRAETTPVDQWAGGRAIRREVKEQLFEHGIEIPSPRMVVYSNKDEKKAE